MKARNVLVAVIIIAIAFGLGFGVTKLIKSMASNDGQKVLDEVRIPGDVSTGTADGIAARDSTLTDSVDVSIRIK